MFPLLLYTFSSLHLRRVARNINCLPNKLHPYSIPNATEMAPILGMQLMIIIFSLHTFLVGPLHCFYNNE